MTADTLRRAASRMRHHAQAASPGPWTSDGFDVYDSSKVGEVVAEAGVRPSDARHIASWDPVVALTVADLLDAAAEGWEFMERQNSRHPDDDGQTRVLPNASDMAALAVARAYLNGEAS